jgi:hypothetical protein
MNRMTERSIYACKNAPGQRWGQAICNQFKFKDSKSLSSYHDKLFNEPDDNRVEKTVRKMILDLNIPKK